MDDTVHADKVRNVWKVKKQTNVLNRLNTISVEPDAHAIEPMGLGSYQTDGTICYCVLLIKTLSPLYRVAILLKRFIYS